MKVLDLISSFSSFLISQPPMLARLAALCVLVFVVQIQLVSSQCPTVTDPTNSGMVCADYLSFHSLLRYLVPSFPTLFSAF